MSILRHFYHLVLLMAILALSASGQNILNPNERPVAERILSDEQTIRHLLAELEYAIRYKEVIRIVRLFDESIDLKTTPKSRLSRIVPELFRIDSISIEINGPTANVQCRVSGISNNHKPRERLIFQKTNAFWWLIGSTLLRELIAEYLFGGDGQNRNGVNTADPPSRVVDLETTTSTIFPARTMSTSSTSGSPITSFTMSTRALFRRPIPYTNIWTLNRTVTTTHPQFQRELFHAPVDGAVIIASGTGDEVVFVLDQSWARIVHGTTAASGIRSYGDNPGDYRFLLPLALDANSYGDIYCIDGIRHQLFRLRYNHSMVSISFVGEINAAGITDPVDVSIQGSSLWVVDRLGNAIAKITPNGDVLGRANRVVDYYTARQYDLIFPSKIVAHPWISMISLVDSYGKRVLTIILPTFDGDKIRGYVIPAEFAPQTNAFIGALGFVRYDELWAVDQANGMLHRLDVSTNTSSGLLASVKFSADGQQQWSSPRAFTSNWMTDSYPFYNDIFTLDTWNETHGINAYLPGADIVNFRASYTNNGIQFEYGLTNRSLLTSQIFNQNNQLVYEFASSQYVWSGRRIDAVQWSQLGSGTFSLRLSVVPSNNPYSQYPQAPVELTHTFTRPPTVSISGPSAVFHTCCKGQPANRYTWTANVSGGTSPYTYSWLRDGSQVSTASSYTEYFSFNGWGGGSYQFTLGVNVRDAQNTLASASMVVGAYNSGDDGGGGELVSMEEQISEATPVPSDFSLAQNYPNPFNPETEIIFGLPEPAHVKITISDLLGREIFTLHEGELVARYYRKRWGGVSSTGEKVGSGIYFYRISARGESGKEFTRVLKMLLLK